MIILGPPPDVEGFDRGHDRLGPISLVALDCGAGRGLLFGRVRKNRRAVLRAHVIALPVQLRGIVDVQENIQNIVIARSEEHTSELQSLMRISYAVFCLKKKTK